MHMLGMYALVYALYLFCDVGFLAQTQHTQHHCIQPYLFGESCGFAVDTPWTWKVMVHDVPRCAKRFQQTWTGPNPWIRSRRWVEDDVADEA